MKNAWTKIRNKSFGDHLGITICILAAIMVFVVYNKIDLSEYIIVAVILGIIALIPLFICFAGRNNKELINYLKMHDMTKEQFDDELSDARVYKKNNIMCIVGPRFAIKTGLKNRLIDYSDLSLVRPQMIQTTNASFGTKTAVTTTGNTTNVAVRFFHKDGSPTNIVPVRNLDDAFEICRYIHTMNPSVEFTDPLNRNSNV